MLLVGGQPVSVTWLHQVGDKARGYEGKLRQEEEEVCPRKAREWPNLLPCGLLALHRVSRCSVRSVCFSLTAALDIEAGEGGERLPDMEECRS